MNMKKILSIALSLVMIMALFTGCGSNKNAKTKDNGSYFKEVKKMQEIKTGTGEVELSFDVSADSIKKDKTIPAKFKKDGKIQGKLKVETTTESTSTTEETTKLSVTKKEDNDVADNNDVKEVKLTLSKALNKDNVPEGWTLSDDGLTLTKTMQKEAVEKLELTATDGEKLNYIVISGKDNVPVMTNVTVDTFGADYGMPDTINYDEVQQKVQQYQNYYQQLMSSYSNSSSTSTEGK